MASDDLNALAVAGDALSDADADPARTARVRACAAELRAWVQSPGALADFSAKELAWCTPATLDRYARARDGSAKAALEALQATLRWRREAVDGPVQGCPACESDAGTHSFHALGFDGHGRAVVWGNPPRAKSLAAEDTVHHVVHTLERCFAHSPCADKGAATMLWCTSFEGFGLRDALSARVGIGFARVFAHHMPERCARIVLLNPPGVFSVLLAALKPFADARTLAKVAVVRGTPAEVAKQLMEEPYAVPPRLAEWIGTAMALEPKPGNTPPLPAGAEPLNAWAVPTEGQTPAASDDGEAAAGARSC